MRLNQPYEVATNFLAAKINGTIKPANITRLTTASASSVALIPHRSNHNPTSGPVTMNAPRNPKLAIELAVARNSLGTREFSASRKTTCPKPRATKKVAQAANPPTAPSASRPR